MENSNGYFQIIRSDKGISIKLFPEKGNGRKIDINEIMEYMELNKIQNCSYVELGKVLKSLSKEETVFVSSYSGYPINEYMKIKISSDGMTAKIRLYPPSNDGKLISIDEMRSDLKNAGVVYGIDERVLGIVSKHPIYCTSFVIAKGKSVTEGKDAYVEYFFNTDRRIKPKHNEDGSVDFHTLNNISHINKGDILARLHPADKGIPGINVAGVEVKPRNVTNTILHFGKNITLSEDKLEIFSNVNGHAVLEGERVFVSNTYDVPGDVDNSTGDIDYEGNVSVHGNVRTGFRIKALGDVEIFGCIEGAEVFSGGNVIIHHGVQGMTKGNLYAKGNIVSKFIESARVFAEGDIETEAIIQCQVSAKGDITVNGQKGHIIGGCVRAGSSVEAKVIGSGMGIKTIVEVGFDPEKQDNLKKLKKALTEQNDEYKKNVQRVDMLNNRLKSGMIKPEQRVELKTCLINMQTIKKNLFMLQDKIDEINASISGNDEASISVHRDIYPGTQLIISGEYHNVNEELSCCKFYKTGGEIKTGVL